MDFIFYLTEALIYAELSILIQKSGGSYSYLMDGLGSLHPFWGPAFNIYASVVVLLRPVRLADDCLVITYRPSVVDYFG